MKVGGSLVKLVIFAVITSILTLMLAATIGNISIGGSAPTYKAVFSDVTGLIAGDDVRIAGVQVGKVKSVRLAKGGVAEVAFTVRDQTRLRTTTLARLRYRNLIGQRFVELAAGAGDGRVLAHGATIPISQTQPALDLTVLFNGFKPLFAALNPADVNRLSGEVIKVLQGEGGTVDGLLRTTASLTNTLADRDAVIGRVIDNLSATLAVVDQRDATLSDLIVQFRRLVAGLAADRGAISASLDNVSALAESTASLLTGIRAPLKTDIAQLGNTAAVLQTTTNAKGQNVLDEYLQRLPSKLNAIVRTASYGGWFNFYLCDAEATSAPGVYHHNKVPSCQVTNP